MSSETHGLSAELRDYLVRHSVTEHPVQVELRKLTSGMEKSVMQVSPEQGKFMQLLVMLTNASKCIEVGVFTGYSALSVALVLPPNGRIHAFDINREWTDIAREYWKKAGVDSKISLKLEPASQGLLDLIESGEDGTFDFAFIDADKTGYDAYYELSLRLLRPGGILAIDNTLWEGKVANPEINDPDTAAIRALNEKIISDNRVFASMLPVGDGLTLVRKL